MNRSPLPSRTVFVALAVLTSATANSSAQLPGAEDSYAKRLGPIVATVGDEPIYGNEVNATLAATLRGRRIARDSLPRLRAEVLEQIVKRRLVAGFLRRDEAGVGDEQVKAEIEKVQSQLAERKVTFEEFLRQRGLTEELLAKQVAWGLGWQEYLKDRLSDEKLEAYFNENRRHFDDSQVRASHVLLAVDDPAAQDQVIEKCRDLRQRILAGELTFAEAAEKYSIGPSRRRGGDLGFFPRRGQMIEAFSKAAFDLEKDEISEPVVTQFGVHLIQCTDVRPGDKQWTELRRKLRESLANELFDEIATAEMQTVGIGYTGAMPYLNPGTKELVMPQQSPEPSVDVQVEETDSRPDQQE